MIRGDTVCAIVVTYNRRELVQQCLVALNAQKRLVDHILLIDNASTDGTAEMLRSVFAPAQFPQIEIVTLENNVGGAGGFHEGIKRAAAGGYDWLWLMDDDTIPRPDALAQLFAARDLFPADTKPDLLASKVVWTDGTLHSMNSCWVDQRDPERTFRAAERGTFPLRTATFVSLLFQRRLVGECGLPIASYFIWGDDTEYTGRILREHFGVAVPQSVVVHKTPRKHASADVSPRFYYHVRNTLWIVLRSRAFSPREKLSQVSQLLRACASYFRSGLNDWSRWRVMVRGLWDGLATRPSH